ncbi:MAG: hypothetical protein AB1505_16670 [Candidatus Latescibacterota bacterium]
MDTRLVEGCHSRHLLFVLQGAYLLLMLGQLVTELVGVALQVGGLAPEVAEVIGEGRQGLLSGYGQAGKALEVSRPQGERLELDGRLGDGCVAALPGLTALLLQIPLAGGLAQGLPQVGGGALGRQSRQVPLFLCQPVPVCRLDSARHQEDYQSVGLLCREALISVAHAVYDPALHASPDGVRPSTTDAGRMVESFSAQAAAGSAHEALRGHSRAALRLAAELQHRRTADYHAAALCLEAISSVTNTVAILSGQRDPGA